MENQYDVLIIGAGPAGLAAGCCAHLKGLKACIVETGGTIAERSHSHQASLGEGVGGSGLYSDGKFSFHPSATELWMLEDSDSLREAYQWFGELLNAHGVSVPSLPTGNLAPDKTDLDGRIKSKSYNSMYMDLATRSQLIQKLQDLLSERLVSRSEVISLTYDNVARLFIAETTSGPTRRIEARYAIFAGGRFGPVQLLSWFPELETHFARLEVGVRIEQPSSKFFLASHPQLDPKLVIELPGHSLRTFCCCRQGETVTLATKVGRCVSGRGDGAPSEISNVGFLARVLDETRGKVIWDKLQKRIGECSDALPLREPLRKFLQCSSEPEFSTSSNIAALFGPELSAILADGLGKLVQEFAIDEESVTLVAPAIESPCYYPVLEPNLRVKSMPLWVIGDSTGKFRGLTAALISGHYSTSQVTADLTFQN